MFKTVNNKIEYKTGFTLIELLVVIAIIGLLAAVVLVSVGSARGKAVDTAVKTQMHQATIAAEQYNSAAPNSYMGVCAATQLQDGFNSMLKTIDGDTVQVGIIATSGPGAWNNVTCHDNSISYVIESPLAASTSTSPSMWCVDSTGITEKESILLGNASTSCP